MTDLLADPWVSSLAAVLVVSLISLAGVLGLAMDRERLERVVVHLVSLAAGALLAGAVVHLLPSAIEALGPDPSLSVWLMVGFVGFFVLEKLLWAHHHGMGPQPHDRAHPVVALNLLGDAVHNFIDGVVIAASFSTSPTLGIVTTTAVLVHEIPQEIGDFGILIHGGLSVGRAVALNFMTALTAVLGVLVTLVFGARVEGMIGALLAITAASFVYIAAADLIPELHRQRGLKRAFGQVAMFGLGVGLMFAVRLVEGALGG